MATITTTDPTGVETMTKEKVTSSPLEFDQPVASVGVKAGLTVNLGNYSSMRVDVSLDMPCYVTELDKVFDFSQEWVDARLEAIHAGIKQSGMISDES